MPKFLITVGALLLVIALYYFIMLIYYLSNSYGFSEYGLGILVGKTLIFLTGIVFVYIGWKQNKKRKFHKELKS